MIQLLLTYKYLLLIPLSIIEGPIVTVIAGFMVTTGIFNAFLVYPIMVVGDIIGDGIIYYIGYSGKKFLHYFKISHEKLEKTKEFFKKNHIKTMVMSKLLHGIGFTGLIAASASHVPYKKYFFTCALISVVQSFVMLMIGILFGNAYMVIGKYLNYYAAGASVIILVVLLLIFVRKNKEKDIRQI